MVKYCRCGYKFWVTTRWNGLEYVAEVRADDERDWRNIGQEVTHCPCCGIRAYPADLLTEPPDQDLSQILLQPIRTEEALLNLARLVLELTAAASKDEIADAARQLAEKVIEFIAPRANDPEAPFGRCTCGAPITQDGWCTWCDALVMQPAGKSG